MSFTLMFLYRRTISFFFNHTATTEIYTLSLHDALPISTASRRDGSSSRPASRCMRTAKTSASSATSRSEEHTSELQSRFDLVCRLLLEKKKKRNKFVAKVYV